jgi:hypothetical protein
MATFTAVTPQQNIPAAGNAGSMNKFIPELWSDEVIAVYEQNLVLAGKVRKMSMKGKKGDTIHIPKPGRDDATAKAAQTAVTLVEDEATELIVSIDQHYEYSRMIEDIADVQAIPSARRFYTEDAGYALARQVDTALFELGTYLGDEGAVPGTPGTPLNWIHSNTIRPTAAGSHELWAENNTETDMVFNDAAFRYGLQLLDDANVPMSNRCLIICPSAVNDIRGITRYNSVDFVNNKGTVNGEIGNIYGVPVFVSTQVPIIEDTTENSGFTCQSRGNLLIQKDAYVLAEQVGVRSQTQYKQEFLSTLFTSDRIYGKSVYRPECGVNIVTGEA